MKRHASKKTDLHSLLKNRNVLYIVLFFSVANLFSYLMMKQLDAVAFFIIAGFLTTYFSKNMIIVMLTSMISTFLLVKINMLGQVQEGMEDKKAAEGETTEKPAAAAATEAKATEKTESDGEEKAPTKAGVSPPDPLATSGIPVKKELREKLTAMRPATYNPSDDDDEPRHKPKVDYAATLESAYDNLDKLLNSDAIKAMTSDTGRLAEKQKLLMGNIEKMTPIMEKASGLLGGFDMGAVTKLLGSMNGLKGIEIPGMDAFTGGAGKEKK